MNTQSSTQQQPQPSLFTLIELNRYGAEDSNVYIITESFLTKWLKFRKKMECTEASIAKLKFGIKVQDEEEVTYIWLPSNEQQTIDRASKTFMKEMEEEMVEEGLEF